MTINKYDLLKRVEDSGKKYIVKLLIEDYLDNDSSLVTVEIHDIVGSITPKFIMENSYLEWENMNYPKLIKFAFAQYHKSLNCKSTKQLKEWDGIIDKVSI